MPPSMKCVSAAWHAPRCPLASPISRSPGFTTAETVAFRKTTPRLFASAAPPSLLCTDQRVFCASVRQYSTTLVVLKAHRTRRRGNSGPYRSSAAAAAATTTDPHSASSTKHAARTKDPSPSITDVIAEDLRLHSAHQQQQQQRTPDPHRGIFQSQHIKPFPVRAAIDIGTGGVMSLCVARVDARAGAIQKLMYQTQLPLHLEKLLHRTDDTKTTTTRGASTGGAAAEAEECFTLSERTVSDITNKMRVLHGAMKRNDFEGLSERAAVLSWPLCRATNAQSLADALTREFKVDVRVLGTSFQVEWPSSVMAQSVSSGNNNRSDARITGVDRDTNVRAPPPPVNVTSDGAAAPVRDDDRLKTLLRNATTAPENAKHNNKTRRSTSDGARSQELHDDKQQQQQQHDDDSRTVAENTVPGSAADLRRQVDTLAFLAHAAVSQCVAPQRLLVLSEDPQKGIRVLGLGTTPAADVADLLASADSPDAVAKLKRIAFGEESTSSSSLPLSSSGVPSSDGVWPVPATTRSAWPTTAEKAAASPPPAVTTSVVPVVHGAAAAGLRLVEHTLPVDAATAHRYCITFIQRRPQESYGLHTSSPNPLLAGEFAALRGLLTDALRHRLPPWVTRKSQLGGMVVATSHNGGVFNIAARVAQQTHVSLDHLEVHAQHHFCGLTDVLLAETFPNPLTVLPSAALSCAVLRALDSPRMLYAPEVSMAAGLLTQPSLWVASRSAEVRQRLSRDPFYAAHTRAQRGRVFERPHRKENPTAAPNATWQRGRQWDTLSYAQSTKGT